MKTTALLIAALFLAGCATKRYEVCIMAEGDAHCMKHDLAKADAVHVGNAISNLGYDVVVKRKGLKLEPADIPSGPVGGDLAPRDDPDQRKL